MKLGLALAAWFRRSADAIEARAKPSRIPDGTPGVRDVDNPCSMFQPGPVLYSAGCETDGHYICDECEHSAPRRRRETEDCR